MPMQMQMAMTTNRRPY